ncbi:SpoIIE family protein phosphatase [Streptomyces coeruleorubidus]|uniref:SpoIIE family protein phosphatase n=1 Tax=Streptomyces coeruleorubidus TaxID=116188 RepID=UPI0033FAAE7C
MTWVNRGHLPPVLIREGRPSSRLSCKPAHPMGTALGLKATMCREQLEPGDRIVFSTDGITEAPRQRRYRTRRGALHRLPDPPPCRRTAVPETLRRLIHTPLDYHDGQLQDDASILICHWLDPTDAPSGDETDRT